MKPLLLRLVLAGAILAVAVAVAGAQTTPTAPSTPTRPRAQGAPPPMPASPTYETVMEGPVKAVDPLGKTVRVGWLLGLASTTLDVTDETRIAIEGTTGSLQDIREGDEVRAAYEVRDGKNIAKSIEVTAAEPRRAATAPAKRVPPGPAAPAPGAPKAP